MRTPVAGGVAGGVVRGGRRRRWRRVRAEQVLPYQRWRNWLLGFKKGSSEIPDVHIFRLPLGRCCLYVYEWQFFEKTLVTRW